MLLACRGLARALHCVLESSVLVEACDGRVVHGDGYEYSCTQCGRILKYSRTLRPRMWLNSLVKLTARPSFVVLRRDLMKDLGAAGLVLRYGTTKITKKTKK